MRGERILYANDTNIAQEGIRRIIEKYAQDDGHTLCGVASSIAELKSLLEDGIRPSVFLLDPKFPTLSDGEEAIKVVRSLSPDTTIVTLPSHVFIKSDFKLKEGTDVADLVNFLTTLPSKSK